jgi:hypothetical protein
MPRRRTITIPASELTCYDTLAEELRRLPQVGDGFDMEAMKIVISERIAPKIKNIDAVIAHLERWLDINRSCIETIKGEQLITRLQLAKMLGITRQTLTDWIHKGFITPIQSKNIKGTETFDTEAVMEELKMRRQKQR